MRVLIDATRTRVGGGIQVALATIRSGLRESSGEWHAVVSGEVYEQLSNVEIRQLNSCTCTPSHSVASEIYHAFWVLPRLERSISPSVVFTVFGPTLWNARSAHLVGFARPRMLYEGAAYGVKGRLFQFWTRVRMRNDCEWLVETDAVRNRMSSRLGIDSRLIHVIRNAYSQEFYVAARRDSKTVTPAGSFRVLVPSAYYPHKNLELVPLVSKELNCLGLDRHEFVFTLPAQSRGYRRISKIAKKLDVAQNVSSLGAIPHDKFHLAYLTSHAVFLPSRLECSSAVYPEAFCAQRPVVTTDMDFSRSNCGDGALYFEVGDQHAAAAKLHSLATDVELYNRVVASGQQALTENYPTPQEKWADQLALLKSLWEKSLTTPKVG